MNIQKTIERRYELVALILAAFSLAVLAGCGTDAPFGTTITVTPFGVPVITDPVSTPTITSTTRKMQSYRVAVTDPAGLPMNDIDVHFLGQFTNGQSITFSSVSGTAPITLTTTKKTDKFGYLLFDISAPYYAVKQLQRPSNQTYVGSATGGTLSEGTIYSYTITAADFAGETEAAAPFTAIVTSGTSTPTATGSITLSWSAVPGATSYNIYGRLPGSEGRLVNYTPASDADPVTWTDDGSYTPTVGPPSGSTSGLSLNSVIGTGQVTSGAAVATFDINF